MGREYSFPIDKIQRSVFTFFTFSKYTFASKRTANRDSSEVTNATISPGTASYRIT